MSTILDQIRASTSVLDQIKFPTSSGYWPVPGNMGLGTLMLYASALKRVKVTKTYADLAAADFTSTITLLELPAGAALMDVYANCTELLAAPTNNHVATVNGTAFGIITVASATNLNVGDYLAIQGTIAAKTNGYLVAKTVVSPTATTLHIQSAAVGGIDVNLAAYTVADAAHVFYDTLATGVMEVGVVGTTNKFLVSGRDILTGPAPVAFLAAADKGAVLKTIGTTDIESFTAATLIVVKVDITGVLVNQLNAGSIDFYVTYCDLE